jgi:molybdopterin/thiamine biosynthesis adenylyltransferase
MLTDKQIERYRCHVALKEVGMEGQQKLLDGRVLIIGAGGLGSPAALYLTAAGIGTIGIVDNDVVELTNLQRQVIHFTPDIGKAKVDSAGEKMTVLNPEVKIIALQERIHTGNIMGIIRGYNFVIDCTDNSTVKLLINDACVLSGIPYSHAGILQFSGQTITVKPSESACYRCIFPIPPIKEATSTRHPIGVIGVLPGVIGIIQATEAIKFLLGKGDLLTGRLLIYNALQMSFDVIQIKKNPKCPLCGETPTIKEPMERTPRMRLMPEKVANFS